MKFLLHIFYQLFKFLFFIIKVVKGKKFLIFLVKISEYEFMRVLQNEYKLSEIFNDQISLLFSIHHYLDKYKEIT